ncbi:hypothetical protein K431DRAFT_45065 [Polychaeton citri CBS 116435]|uniref:Uncharacterized protein n=1 Tax=Polychaeton citri CBS 116435 TaxID=1314669 RepID=A0A9P4UQ67_9PEZI|nr:hypothetical protein K431DRAFT_45065 [Polychaeton citri CBS 116435]
MTVVGRWHVMASCLVQERVRCGQDIQPVGMQPCLTYAVFPAEASSRSMFLSSRGDHKLRGTCRTLCRDVQGKCWSQVRLGSLHSPSLESACLTYLRAGRRHLLRGPMSQRRPECPQDSRHTSCSEVICLKLGSRVVNMFRTHGAKGGYPWEKR